MTNDLYLDLDIAPDGKINILDVDELDKALQQGAVSTFEYNLAWHELDNALTAIEADMFSLLWRAEEHFELLQQLLQ